MARRSLARSVVLASLLVGTGALRVSTAHAGGFDLTARGTRAVGRGGATTAGADDPLALFHNPAQLASMGGDPRAQLSLQLMIPDVCMQRDVVDESGPEPVVDQELNRVCNDYPVSPVPTAAVALPVAEGWTLGAGIEVPINIFHQRWDDEVPFEDGSGGTTQVLPTRWILTEVKLALVFPSVGVGWEPHPRFRLGATFGWGLAQAELDNAAFARLGPLSAETRNHIVAADYFIPRVTVGAHAEPVDGLELGAMFRWTQTLHTGDSEVTFRDSLGLLPEEGETVPASLDVPLNAELYFGVRYAEELARPVDDLGDRLSSERWDIEANVGVLFNERFDRILLNLPDGATILGIDLPDEFALEQQWRNQVVVRVGGDYNPIPGKLGLRAGFSYETHGVERGYEQLFFLPLEQYGAHVGATVRPVPRFDLSLAYAYLHRPASELGPDQAKLRRASTDPADAILSNAGTLRSAYHVVAVGGAFSF